MQWKASSDTPTDAGVYGIGKGVFRRWDGQTWHRGSKTAVAAAGINDPLPKSRWLPWMAPNGQDMDSRLQHALATDPRPALELGPALVALGEAMGDPDTTLGELSELAQAVGLKLEFRLTK
jgi:hypothetical protein